MAILPKSNSALVTMSSWSQSAQASISPLIEKVSEGVVHGIEVGKTVLERYPPLKAFAIAVLVFSVLPLAIFLGFAGTSGAVVFGVAGTGIALTQGFFLSFFGFFLLLALGAAIFGAGVVTFWFSAAYFGIETVKKMVK